MVQRVLTVTISPIKGIVVPTEEHEVMSLNHMSRYYASKGWRWSSWICNSCGCTHRDLRVLKRQHTLQTTWLIFTEMQLLVWDYLFRIPLDFDPRGMVNMPSIKPRLGGARRKGGMTEQAQGWRRLPLYIWRREQPRDIIGPTHGSIRDRRKEYWNWKCWLCAHMYGGMHVEKWTKSQRLAWK
jgi:hypothetical protein